MNKFTKISALLITFGASIVISTNVNAAAYDPESVNFKVRKEIDKHDKSLQIPLISQSTFQLN